MQVKKEKKVKDKGSRHPGTAKGVEANPDGHVEGDGEQKVNLADSATTAVENLNVAK